MRRNRIVVTHLLGFSLGCVFAAAADDVQVIRSQRSVLSIYSYGARPETRVAPELPDRHYNRATGALTDVVSTPALSSAVPMRTTWPRTEPTRVTRTFATPLSGSGRDASTANIGQPELTMPLGTVSAPQSVTVGWDASPDPSVTGYKLYAGNASGHYTVKQPIGNQTTAELPLDQGTLYVAVSAYTAEGFESALSRELIVAVDAQQNGGAGGGAASAAAH